MADTFFQPVQIVEQSDTPATPSSGYQKIYPKSDGKMYALNASGVETEITNISDAAIKLFNSFNFI